MHVSHDFGFTRAPMSPDRDPKRCQELVAQGLFVVIVFGSHYRENGSSASSLLEVADTCRFACTRIGNNDPAWERLCQAERNMAWNRLAKAVSMNGYVLKGEGVMLTIPLTSGASVRYGQDDQRRHLELLSSFWVEPVSSSRCPLSAQRLRRGGSLLVGDPIDVLARLHESRFYDVSAHALLRPEYANGPLALANARVSPASHRVYAWHGPPTSLCAPPSIVGNRLLQRRSHPRTN